MPTYDYRCERCGAFQALRSIASRDAEARCPACGAVAARILSGSPHVGGVRRTLATAGTGDAGPYGRLRQPASCRCCGGG
jgi:putative FmdB family regulatory protein